MKRIKSILLVLIMIMPAIVYAAGSYTREGAVQAVNGYMSRESFKTSSSKYIYGAVPFLKSEEYNASKITKKNGSQKTYLFDGVSYYLEGSKIITYGGEVKADDSESHSAKAVEIVKPETKVTGSGKYDNPWTFTPVYTVSIRVNDTQYGELEGSTTQYVAKGQTATFTGVRAKSGFVYLTNNCGGEYIENGNKFVIRNIKSDTSCMISFGTGRFTLTLNKATPGKIYVNYKDNYYKDEDRKNPINKLDRVEGKAGYTYVGYYYNGTKIIYGHNDKDASGNSLENQIIRNTAGKITKSETLDPTYKINKPSVPAISGAATKIYGSSDTELTCTNNDTYASGAVKYYSFGYATSDGGAPSNWSEASTSNKYIVGKTSYPSAGDRYYSCRIYVSDGTQTTQIVASLTSADALVRYNNAKITFNANGGTLDGSASLYTRSGQKRIFTGVRNTTAGTVPVAKKAGNNFDGWYTAASGGTQIIKSDRTVINNITFTSDTTLYAHYSACPKGQYNTGSTVACQKCAAGTYSNEVGKTTSTCTACAAGSYSAAGASACTPCSAGTYQASTGKTSCDNCPTGYTTDGTGKTAKSACYTSCAKDKRVNSADAQCTSSCATGYTIAAHKVYASNTSNACSAIKTTVSFNANGGSGGQTANVTATYNSAMPGISTTKPAKTNAIFMGWYDNSDYTKGTQYYTAGGASAKNWDKTTNTTLYAGWRPCITRYVVTYIPSNASESSSGRLKVDISKGNSNRTNWGPEFTPPNNGLITRVTSYVYAELATCTANFYVDGNFIGSQRVNSHAGHGYNDKSCDTADFSKNASGRRFTHNISGSTEDFCVPSDRGSCAQCFSWATVYYKSAITGTFDTDAAPNGTKVSSYSVCQ